MSNQKVLDGIIASCSKDLFAAYGLEVSLDQPSEDHVEMDHAGVIGFCGDAMRGTLLLVPCKGVIERTLTQDARPQDWVGELANQLLGRIKNQLLRYGAELHMTTPLVLRGQRIAPTPTVEPRPHYFRAGVRDQLMIWFDAELSPSLELVEQAAQEIPSEGDAFIF